MRVDIFIRDFIEDLNGNGDFIDANNRLKAIILYNGKFYFGHTHGGILSHILTGTDTLEEVIYRDNSIKYNRNQKKVAFGNLIEKNIIVFEDLQSFWNNDEDIKEEEEEFYNLTEIIALLRSNRKDLSLVATKAYTVLRDSHTIYASYNLESLKQVL